MCSSPFGLALLRSFLFGCRKCFTHAYFCFYFNVSNLIVCQIVKGIDGGVVELHEYHNLIICVGVCTFSFICAVVSVSPILDLFILETSLLLPNLFGCLIKNHKKSWISNVSGWNFLILGQSSYRSEGSNLHWNWSFVFKCFLSNLRICLIA